MLRIGAPRALEKQDKDPKDCKDDEDDHGQDVKPDSSSLLSLQSFGSLFRQIADCHSTTPPALPTRVPHRPPLRRRLGPVQPPLELRGGLLQVPPALHGERLAV